jgi:hypothetical protein
MNLDDTQRRKVTDWIEQGLKLSEIQTRLEKELGLRMTYLEVRFLVDELKLMPKDPVAPEPKPAELAAKPAPADKALKLSPEPEPEATVAGKGNVSVSVDQIARPGAVVSGKVTFSDGKTATWYLDEMGRLGLGASERGYKPSAADIELFQIELQREMQKMGY